VPRINCHNNRFDEAVADYEMAVEIEPENAQLRSDLEMIRGTLRTS